MEANKFKLAKSAMCIVDIVKQTVDLKHDGDVFKGLCPFHDEKTPSFQVSQKHQNFRCWGCGEKGDAIDFVKKLRGCTKAQAAEHILELKDCSRSLIPKKKKPEPIIFPPIEWERLNLSFWPKDAQMLSIWRGYSLGFCLWLCKSGLIGRYDDCICFPIHHGSVIVRAHCRAPSGKWFYHPQKLQYCKTSAMIIGGGKTAHIFESQWDCFAALDASRQWMRHRKNMDTWIATRGASNSFKLAGLSFEQAYLYPQNDTAGQDNWLPPLVKHFTPNVICKTPKPHKDVNDALRAKVTLAAINGYFAR